MGSGCGNMGAPRNVMHGCRAWLGMRWAGCVGIAWPVTTPSRAIWPVVVGEVRPTNMGQGRHGQVAKTGQAKPVTTVTTNYHGARQAKPALAWLTGPLGPRLVAGRQRKTGAFLPRLSLVIGGLVVTGPRASPRPLPPLRASASPGARPRPPCVPPPCGYGHRSWRFAGRSARPS